MMMSGTSALSPRDGTYSNGSGGEGDRGDRGAGRCFQFSSNVYLCFVR